MHIKFKFLTGDMNWQDYGGKWISQKFNNGEFDFCFVRELINMPDAIGERACKRDNVPKYSVSVSVVAPEEFKERKSAMDSMGIDSPWDSLCWEQKVEVINGYSGGASVYQGQGNNYKELFKLAQKETVISEFLFGFAMDKAQNAIGNTGWDWIKGDIGFRAVEDQRCLS
jgi:hypothetical protein